jgi:hypothetical protein
MAFFFKEEHRKLRREERLRIRREALQGSNEERLRRIRPMLDKRYHRYHSDRSEPADAVVTRLFNELQQHRSPQQERNLFTRLLKRLSALPSPDRVKE